MGGRSSSSSHRWRASRLHLSAISLARPAPACAQRVPQRARPQDTRVQITNQDGRGRERTSDRCAIAAGVRTPYARPLALCKCGASTAPLRHFGSRPSRARRTEDPPPGPATTGPRTQRAIEVPAQVAPARDSRPQAAQSSQRERRCARPRRRASSGRLEATSARRIPGNTRARARRRGRARVPPPSHRPTGREPRARDHAAASPTSFRRVP